MRDEDVYRLQRQIQKLYRRVQREQPPVEGMSKPTLQVLDVLARSAGAVRPSEVGAQLDMASSNVAAALRVLEAQNLVERRTDLADSRKALLELTSNGQRVVADLRRDWHAWLQGAIDTTLSPHEQRVLLEACDLMDRLAGH